MRIIHRNLHIRKSWKLGRRRSWHRAPCYRTHFGTGHLQFRSFRVSLDLWKFLADCAKVEIAAVQLGFYFGGGGTAGFRTISCHCSQHAKLKTLMESVSYPTSGALNRAHYALVAKIENASSSSEVESAILGVINEIRHRILRGSGSAFGRLEDLARDWGVHLPTVAAWDPVSEQCSAIPANSDVVIHLSTSHLLV